MLVNHPTVLLTSIPSIPFSPSSLPCPSTSTLTLTSFSPLHLPIDCTNAVSNTSCTCIPYTPPTPCTISLVSSSPHLFTTCLPVLTSFPSLLSLPSLPSLLSLPSFP